jgi:hypothetical protein
MKAMGWTRHTLLMISSFGALAAMGGTVAQPALARVDYDLVRAPVLTYSGDAYGLVFRLDRRLPRASGGSVKATVSLNGKRAERISTVAGRPHCYVAVLHGYFPRYGEVYKVIISAVDAEPLAKRVRLHHATRGYGAFLGNADRDPRARDLKCAARFRSRS